MNLPTHPKNFSGDGFARMAGFGVIDKTPIKNPPASRNTIFQQCLKDWNPG
ncbi:MAG TPA: hypothetical protein VG347_22810 [Verrucomicrobiae bacterium]|nr:hypothetical protein [Verrucomicrobiae bacterium]